MKFDPEAILNSFSADFGLPAHFFRGVLDTENKNRDPSAVNTNLNGTRDLGLWQINETNVPFLQKAGIISSADDLLKPEINSEAARALFKDLKRQGAATPEQYAAGYNTGNIKNVAHPYVGKVLTAAGMKEPEEGGAARNADGSLATPPGTPPETASGTFNIGKNSSMLEDFLNKATSAGNAATDAARGAFDTVAQAGKDSLDTIQKLTATLQESIMGANSFALKREANSLAIAGDFGLDRSKSDNIIAATAAEAQSLEAQHKQAYAEWSKLNETSFFDNPLAWLSAQLSMPAAAAKVNDLSAKYESVTNAAAKAIALTTNAIQVNNLSAATTSKEQAELQARATGLKGVQEMINAKVITAEQGVRLMQVMSTIGTQQVGMVLGAVKADVEYSQKLYMNFQRELVNNERQAKAEEAAQQLADAKMVVQRFNAATGNNFAFEQVKQMGAAEKSIVQRIGSTGQLGTTVPEVLNNSKYVQQTPENAGVRKTIERLRTEFNQEVRVVTQKYAASGVKDRGLIEQEAGIQVQLRYGSYLGDVGAGQNNPYAGAAPAAILADPALRAKLPLLGKVLEPVAAQPNAINANAMADMAVKAAMVGTDGKIVMPSGKVLSQLANEISAYYSAVVRNNNNTFQYRLAGLPLQENYKSTATGLLGPNQAVDFTNPANVMSVLLMKATNQVRVIQGSTAEAEINRNQQVRRQAEREAMGAR